MKNSIKTVFVIIGTLIGAGFTSGQEIYSFFNQYRENGILGIIVACLITGVVIYRVLKISNKDNIKSYPEFLERKNNFKILKYSINIIINLFLLMSFYIMVSGFTAYFKQEFNVPTIASAIIVLLLCYITFMKNIEGIAKINSIIIPILIGIVLLIGIKTNIIETAKNLNFHNLEFSGNWLLKSIEYASYNSILLIPILISLKNYAKNNEKRISILTTSIFFILSIVIYLIMFNVENIRNIEIPMVYIASKFGNLFKYGYGIVIIFAISSTMISAGFGFLQNCTKSKKAYKALAIVMCISSIFICNFSFANLVNVTYPVFGLLGIVQFIYMYNIKQLKLSTNKIKGNFTKGIEKNSKNWYK